MGVTSRMVVMVMPAACSARSADSRPEPGPETLTSRVRTPCSDAFLPASSAAIWAAYGVDLREPLKPIMPALDHEMVLPCASVMVTVVLLNEAFTCATPEVMFLRSRFLTRAGSLATEFASLTSSCRRSAWPDPCGCGRWCGCADRGRAGPCGGAG